MSDENLHEEPEKVEEEKKDEDISQVSYGQCYICKINVQYNSFQVFSCRHIICYTCISRLLLIDELSCLENKSNVTITCTCNKGNIECSYKELNNFFSYNFSKYKDDNNEITCNVHFGNKAISYCKKCKIEFCQKCMNENRHDENDGHNVVSLEEYFRKRNVRRPNFTFDTYEEFEKEIFKIKNEFKSFADIENNKKLEIIENLTKKLNELNDNYRKQYLESLNNIDFMFDTLLNIYKIYYNDTKENKEISVNRYKLIKKIKKDFKGITFIPEDLSNLEKIDKIINEFSNQNHLNYKFNFVHYNMLCLGVLEGHLNTVTCLTQIDSGFLASGSQDQFIKIWNVLSLDEEEKKYKCISTMKGHTDYIFSLLNIHENKLLSGGRDDQIIEWDVNDYHININEGEQKEIHNNNVSTYYPNGKIEQKYPIYGPEKIPETQYNKIKSIFSKAIFVHCMKKLSNNNIAYCGRDETIKIINSNLKIIKILKGHENTIFSLDELYPNILITASADKMVKIWDLQKNKCLITYKGHKDEVHSVVALKNKKGEFASASIDKTIKILCYNYNPEMKGNEIKLIKNLIGHTDGIISMIQLKDTRLASGSCDCTIRLWDIKDYVCVQVINGHKNSVFALCQLKDGRLISGSADKTIKIWN
jgi:WD40 repeat protein